MIVTLLLLATAVSSIGVPPESCRVPCTACPQASRESPAQRKAHAGKEEALDRVLGEFEANAVLPGFAVSIFCKDQVHYQRGFGFADLSEQRAYTVDTVQCIASITKTTVAVALMQAVEEGALTLDDDINDHLPFEVVNPHRPEAAITLRHLATHTAGIEDKPGVDYGYLFAEKLDPEDFPEAWHSLLETYNKNQEWELEAYLRRIFTPTGEWYSPQSFSDHLPGARAEYSNLGIALLGLAIQKARGHDFRDLTQAEIFEPLAMDSTTWFLDDVLPESRAIYYNEWIRPVPPYSIASFPDGGLYTSIHDLTRFQQEIMKATCAESRLLRQDSVDEMMSRQSKVVDLPHAIVWELDSPGLLGHGGNDFGTATLMYYRPDTGIGRILFSNVSLESQELEQEFFAIFNALFELDFHEG